MNYIVVEAQTTNGTTALLTTVHTARNEAESKYHLVLSAAAVSGLDRHSAVLLDETGATIRSQCYENANA